MDTIQEFQKNLVYKGRYLMSTKPLLCILWQYKNWILPAL